MNWIVKNFVCGLVIILPIALTIYLFYEAFLRLDRLLPLKVPGAGLAILIVLTVLVGALASNFFVRKFLQLAVLIFTLYPIVLLIYVEIRGLIEVRGYDQMGFTLA